MLFYVVVLPGIRKTAAVLNTFKNAQGNRRCFNLFLTISKKSLLKNIDDSYILEVSVTYEV